MVTDKVKTVYRQRKVSETNRDALLSAGFEPLMARLLASRGVTRPEEMDESVGALLPPAAMKGCKEAGELLAETIRSGGKAVVVADYDCDGATACAVILRGLRLLGAAGDRLGYVVPDRAVHGYGLTPAIVDLALEQKPDLLVTVDNGIASFEGVAYAKSKGLAVLVTDHHLTALVDGVPSVPDADVLVNPNQPGCAFPSKNLCGAGVAFYVILAARSALRDRGHFAGKTEPSVSELLALVALGTIADVVKLDANNRRLVALGLRRMRAGSTITGIRSLLAVAGVDADKVNSTDLGFRIGPRVNAAGRLADMRLGIECLITGDQEIADELAQALHGINAERKAVQADMAEVAERVLEAIGPDGIDASIVVFDPSFHEGVIGIVAGRLKEVYHRPTFVFAKSHEGTAKGSGRSIPGVHLRDVLDLVSKRHPDLLLRFGGHAMAAGVTVMEENVELFGTVFEAVCRDLLSQETRQRVVQHDGSLGKGDYQLATVDSLDSGVWGNGFESPLFVDEAVITSQRLVGGGHLKLSLQVDGEARDAIWFGRSEPLGDRATLAYTVAANVWKGRRSVQMLIQGEWRP